ncbi:MAG: MBL fold metallo-hydrolase [Bacteroidales bacterium]|nr:MBL fold metallo-hydrolase [Bacteroidales bacterium]
MAKSFFRIEMLPAIQGDALWIEYGTESRTRHILVDGGPINAFPAVEKKLKSLPDDDKRVELVVITHVDTDHIEGIIRLFADDRTRWPFMPVDIWFNGWRHLRKSEMLGGREGDFLSALISRRAFNEWNKAFDRKAVMAGKNRPLPVKELKDGMKLTLLSPDPEKLSDMAGKWEADVEKFGLDPGDLEKAWKQLVASTKYHVSQGVLGGESDFEQKLKKQLSTDQSVSNGTSIAFLAEFGGKSCLFLGDAHHKVICNSIRKLTGNSGKRLKADAVKVSHHGSRNNISKDLMDLIDSKHFLFSTNGELHNHPNKSAVDAVIKWSVQKPVLWFNYKTKFNSIWSAAPAGSKKGFTAKYPPGGKEGIIVEL